MPDHAASAPDHSGAGRTVHPERNITMQRVLIAALLLSGGEFSALSQAADDPPFEPPTGPYADAYADARMTHYKQIRADVLDDVRTIYFATGCGILSEDDAEPLINAEATYLEQEALSIHFLDVQQSDLREDAAREGSAQASVAGGCDYWGQHPEAVLAMLGAATAAMTPPPGEDDSSQEAPEPARPDSV